MLILAFLGLDAVASLTGIIISYRRIPFSKFQIRRSMPLYSFLSPTLMAIALIGYYVALVKNFNSFSPSDIKVAVLLTLIAAAIALMAYLPINSPILPFLNSIRQDLVLDKIDVDWATKQIDIALSGMRVGDLLQEDIKEILNYYDRENNLLRKLMRTLKSVESFVPTDAASLEKNEFLKRSEAAVALMKDAERQANQLNLLDEESMKRIQKYSEKAKFIISMDRRTARGIGDITKKIETAQKELKGLIETTRAQVSKLGTTIDINAS